MGGPHCRTQRSPLPYVVARTTGFGKYVSVNDPTPPKYLPKYRRDIQTQNVGISVCISLSPPPPQRIPFFSACARASMRFCWVEESKRQHKSNVLHSEGSLSTDIMLIFLLISGGSFMNWKVETSHGFFHPHIQVNF